MDYRLKQNAFELLRAMERSTLMSPCFQIGIMAVVMKECGFEIKRERGYSNTSNERIRKIFPSRTKKLSDERLFTLKKSDVDFFCHVYNRKLGNNNHLDGFLYRGGGWPQITGKANFKKYCPKNVRLDNCMNHVDTVAEMCVSFFKTGLIGRTILTARYGKPTTDEIGAMWAANIAAGIGHGKRSAVVQRATVNALRHVKEMRSLYDEYWSKRMATCDMEYGDFK